MSGQVDLGVSEDDPGGVEDGEIEIGYPSSPHPLDHTTMCQSFEGSEDEI
jgi:hypothetical protein